jgi:hypothetical protein
MSIILDSYQNTQTNLFGAGFFATITTLYTCSGTQRLLVVLVGGNGTQAPNVTQIKYNNVSLTKAVSIIDSTSAKSDSEVWYLLNPATGTNSLAIGINNPSNDAIIQSTACSWNGVLQTAPLDSTASASAFTNGFSTNIVTGVANALVVADTWNSSGRSLNPTTMTAFAANVGVAYNILSVPAGAFTATWVMSGGGIWTHALASFKPAPAVFVGINEVDG